jgi:dynein heavy chain
LCCENDVIVSRLPDLEKQLYECQRKLDKYLETKKQIFARFYFVSDETLLSILSTGSNPDQIQI